MRKILKMKNPCELYQSFKNAYKQYKNFTFNLAEESFF